MPAARVYHAVHQLPLSPIEKGGTRGPRADSKGLSGSSGSFWSIVVVIPGPRFGRWRVEEPPWNLTTPRASQNDGGGHAVTHHIRSHDAQELGFALTGAAPCTVYVHGHQARPGRSTTWVIATPYMGTSLGQGGPLPGLSLRNPTYMDIATPYTDTRLGQVG